MSSLKERLAFIRAGMTVRRYHQYSTTEIDTVGKHSCGVALLANLIDPTARKGVFIAALFHDLGEAVLGDIPSPTKKMLSEAARDEIDDIELNALRSQGFDTELLTPDESAMLKLCDCFDGLSFCIEERIRGNRSINVVAEKYIVYLTVHMNSVPEIHWKSTALQVFTVLVNNWSNANVNR